MTKKQKIIYWAKIDTFSFYAEEDIKQNIVLDFLGLNSFSCVLID